MRRSVGAALLVVLAVACSGRAAVSAEDLPEIALRQDEAPEGSVYSEERSGPQTLADFGGSAEELEAQGFQGAYSELFAADEHGHAHEGSPFVANFLAAFDSDDGAAWSFDEYSARFPDDGSYEEIPAEGFGDEAFAARGAGSAQTEGQPWIVYSWRSGNLHVYLSIQGEVSREEALEMARAIDARADSVAGS